MEEELIEQPQEIVEPMDEVIEQPREIDFDSIDWQNFDVSFDSYFNGDDDYTADEYEKIFKFVNGKCNESGKYAIDCFDNRYTVRKKSEIDERVASMITPEQKAENKRSERGAMLRATDVYMLPDFPIGDEKRELYKQYRQYLRDLPESLSFPNVDVLTFEQWGGDNDGVQGQKKEVVDFID